MKIVLNGCYGGFGLSEKAEKYMSEHATPGYENCPEADPALVSFIETFGSEAASADLGAKLEVTEIKDGTIYRASEYDGWEDWTPIGMQCLQIATPEGPKTIRIAEVVDSEGIHHKI